MRRWKTALGLALMIPLLGQAPAWAENEGLAELDRATELKLTADSFDDLAVVIEHAEAALKQGLNEENAAFAKALLASAHYERGAALSGAIFGEGGADPRWPQLRRLALPELEKALEFNPHQPRASFLLARLQTLPGGDQDAALKALDAVIAAKQVEPALLAKSYTLRAGLQTEDAKRLADFTKAIQLAPDQPGALRARGLFYLVKENVKGAITDLQKAAELEPGDVPTIEALSLALMMDKQFDAALKHLNEAIEISPDSASLYSNRARLYIAEEQFDKALADLDKAIARRPDSLPTLLLRARVHAQTGDMKKALADVSQALQARPGYLPALRLRAELLAGSGKIDEAIAGLEQLTAALPTNGQLLLQLGTYYLAGQKPRRAIEVFDAVLKAEPSNWRALRSRADARLSVGRQAQAIEDYEAALKLQPDNTSVLNNLAWVLATSPDAKLRDGERAIELAKKAAELTEYKQAHILSTLAAAYAETGDFEQARQWSKKAVAADDGTQTDQLKKELESYQANKPWRELQNIEEQKPARQAQQNRPARTVDF